VAVIAFFSIPDRRLQSTADVHIKAELQHGSFAIGRFASGRVNLARDEIR
jgi:hypothetical protein